MKRIAKILSLGILLITIIAFILFSIPSLVVADNNSDSSFEYTNSWTKAVCNETHCQDYVIYCDGDEFVRQSPITGAVISIPSGWEDPRDETMKERVCNFY